MFVALEGTAASHGGIRIWIRSDQSLVVGRTCRADVAVPDRCVSGVHFSLQCDHRSCQIRDLESSNGTFVNGERVTAAVLKSGDIVVAGETTFQVRIEKKSAAEQSEVSTQIQVEKADDDLEKEYCDAISRFGRAVEPVNLK